MSHITSTERFAKAGPYTYTYPMKNTLIGYARCSTDKQDLSAQGQALFNLGVSEDNIVDEFCTAVLRSYRIDRIQGARATGRASLPASPWN